MGEIIKIGNNSDLEKVNDEVELVELTEGLLQEARATIEKNKVLSVPISGLATLGTGVATLLPALNKLTGSNETFYRLANAAVGDSLKLAKMVIFGELSTQQLVAQNLRNFKQCHLLQLLHSKLPLQLTQLL